MTVTSLVLLVLCWHSKLQHHILAPGSWPRALPGAIFKYNNFHINYHRQYSSPLLKLTAPSHKHTHTDILTHAKWCIRHSNSCINSFHIRASLLTMFEPLVESLVKLFLRQKSNAQDGFVSLARLCNDLSPSFIKSTKQCHYRHQQNSLKTTEL